MGSLWIHEKPGFDFLLKATETYRDHFISKMGRKHGFPTEKEEGTCSRHSVLNLVERDPEGTQTFWRPLLNSWGSVLGCSFVSKA